ncbi:MAG: M20 family metallopeptidase [Bacteroidota bacterium]
MDTLKVKVQQLSKQYLTEIIALRRHLHANPELAFDEFVTGDMICAELDKANIQYKRHVAKTGIVALIEGKNPAKKSIGLRADMDALQINEKNHVDYCSKNDGKMHACGHDVHMASLIGAAKILNSIKDSFEGTIKLLFQPSEEKYPGGANLMIQEGVLGDPDVSIMIGQHVHPELNSGTIGLKSGKSMASTDEIYITVNGKGGHAATPELIVDPIVIASHVVIGLQQIVSRMATPTIPTVLSFGRIVANGKTNIIPDEVFMEGTFRTVDENWRNQAHKLIKQIAENIANAYNGSCDVFIDRGYPYLLNDDKVTARVKNYAIDFLGEENVLDIDLRMTAEDFAYYSHTIPSCFYRLGVKGKTQDEILNLHTAGFNVDESCLETGMGFMAWVALNELK